MLLLSRLDYARLRPLKNVIYGFLIFSDPGGARARAHRARLAAGDQPAVLLLPGLRARQGAADRWRSSALVVDRARRLRERETTALVMLAALVPAMFVIAQPDLGSGMVYMVIAFMLLFVAGVAWRHLAALVALALIALTFVLVAAPAVGVHVLKPYQVERLTAFLHPSTNPQKEGYQQEESKIAIGSGQKTGRGVNASQSKLGYVPENHTDFIFAAVGEQYGFVGAALVLALYGLLIWRALRILVMSKDLFGTLVAAGVAAMLMFQVFVNVGMTIGIMPITGVTLPLMSYGGSSVITTLLAVGLLQSIYVQARASQALKGRVLR